MYRYAHGKSGRRVAEHVDEDLVDTRVGRGLRERGDVLDCRAGWDDDRLEVRQRHQRVVDIGPLHEDRHLEVICDRDRRVARVAAGACARVGEEHDTPGERAVQHARTPWHDEVGPSGVGVLEAHAQLAREIARHLARKGDEDYLSLLQGIEHRRGTLDLARELHVHRAVMAERTHVEHLEPGRVDVGEQRDGQRHHRIRIRQRAKIKLSDGRSAAGHHSEHPLAQHRHLHRDYQRVKVRLHVHVGSVDTHFDRPAFSAARQRRRIRQSGGVGGVDAQGQHRLRLSWRDGPELTQRDGTVLDLGRRQHQVHERL